MALSTLCALMVQSCTFVSDFAIKQCKSDADCHTLGTDTLRCEQARCVPTCRDNRECIALDPRYPLCSAPNGTCLGIVDDEAECYASTAYDDETMGNLTASDMTMIGAFSPTLRSSTWLSLELAIDEINAFTKASDSGQRPVLAVLCNGSSEAIPAVIQHLAGALGIRVMLASLDDDALRIAVALPRSAEQALFLSTHSVAVDGEAQRQAGSRLWYLGGLQQAAIDGYPAIIRRGLAASARINGESGAIVGVVGRSAEDTALADAVEAVIEVDGVRVTELKAFDRYRRVVLNDDSPQARDQVMEDLVRYAPDLVLTFLGGTFASPPGLERSSFIVSLDAALAETTGQPPLYILGPRSSDDSALRAWAVATPSFRTRAVLIDADRSTDEAIFRPAADRFSQAYPRAGDAGTLSLSAVVYDAVYYLTYAASLASTTAGNRQDVGVLIDGLESVSDSEGVRVLVGPGQAGLETAVLALTQFSSLDLAGTTGTASFDFSQRARPAPVRLRCWSDTFEVTEIGVFDAEQRDFGVDAAPCAQAILGEQ